MEDKSLNATASQQAERRRRERINAHLQGLVIRSLLVINVDLVKLPLPPYSSSKWKRMSEEETDGTYVTVKKMRAKTLNLPRRLFAVRYRFAGLLPKYTLSFVLERRIINNRIFNMSNSFFTILNDSDLSKLELPPAFNQIAHLNSIKPGKLMDHLNLTWLCVIIFDYNPADGLRTLAHGAWVVAANKIDFLSLSYTRHAQDVHEACEYLSKLGDLSQTQISVKIENVEGLTH
ncbi:hypothetical protein QVD17_37211 [Tagetes erecta]|uniref:Uncharacterized protein n=1 Tax=Tagetes erecta TaxID=13708 RepID=A0AAD8NIZ4_TARER|nr:hypothetical protein QVD17_37211 [Tagetes erecta]